MMASWLPTSLVPLTRLQRLRLVWYGKRDAAVTPLALSVIQLPHLR